MRALACFILAAAGALANNPVGNTSTSVPGSGLIARYDFHEGSGTTLHNVAPGKAGVNDLTITAGCTWTTASLHIPSGTNSCGITIPDALFNQTKTFVVVATWQQGTGYHCVLCSSTSSPWWIVNQDNYNFLIDNFSAATDTNRTAPGAFDVALGLTNMVTWVRSATLDHVYLAGAEVAYSAQHANGSYTASTGNTLQFGRSNQGAWGFNNDFFEILLYSTELTQAQIAQVYRGERFLLWAKATATGGAGGVLDPRPTVAVMGDSEVAGTTNPLGPGGGVQASGWDVANLIATGSTVLSGASVPSWTMTTPTRTLNNAVQGASLQGLINCVPAYSACSASGGDAVSWAMYNFRMEASRNIFVFWEIVNNVGAGAAAFIASNQSIIATMRPYYQSLPLTNIISTSMASGGNNTTLLAVNADIMAHSVDYGALNPYDLYSQPNMQDTSATYRWDGLHPNMLGMSWMAKYYLAALSGIYLY
jgi:hypothetical protein